MAALLLLAAPMEKARAQTQGAAEITEISVSNFDKNLQRDYGAPARAVTGFAKDINVVVTFSSPVVVTGNPQIVLAIGTQERYVDFEYINDPWSGFSACITDTGCRSLHFNCWVSKSDLDTDGIGMAEAGLVLNGGTTTSGGKPASLNLAGAVIRIADHSGATLKVDGRLRWDTAREDPPFHLLKVPASSTIVSLAPTNPSNPTGSSLISRGRDVSFGLGDEILLWVGFNVPVTVTGTPRLKLLFGEGSGYAGYLSGTDNYDWEIPPGQTTRHAYYDPTQSSPYGLVFSYTVQTSNFDGDGYLVPHLANHDSHGPSLTLNGGSIVTHGGTARLIVDGMSPAFRGACWLSRCLVDGGGGSDPNPGGGTNRGGGSPRANLRVSRVAFTGAPAREEAYRLGEQIRWP